MNVQRLTKKSLEAVEAAQNYSRELENMQIEQIHLLWALVQDQEGLIPQLLIKMDLTPQQVLSAAEAEAKKLPGVSGPGREADKIYISQNLDRAMTAAEKKADSMKDDYISVEHLFWGLLEHPDAAVKKVMEQCLIDKNAFLSALMSVRGNTRVTTDSPEGTYDALKKYGTDLVEQARKQKLDPVIGRDTEIRNVIRILSRKSKNNPVLIGEPGVGKTAIAEGLAQRIVRGDVPAGLQG